VGLLEKNHKYIQNFANETFWGPIQIYDFTSLVSSYFSKLLKNYPILTRTEQTFINTKLITKCWIKNWQWPMHFSNIVLFSIREMWLENFQVLKLEKLFNSPSNINMEPNFLI
jgi:hypothetical protein